MADATALKFSNAQLKRLEKIYAPDIIPMKSYLSIREVRKLLYLLGVETFCDKVWLGWASDDNLSSAVGWRALLALAESWEKPEFPLTGQMVCAAGVPEGEAVGRIMREVEEWWIDADFIDDAFSVIERLKAIVQATIYTRQ
jgi:poly(A) polymerase